MQRFHFGVETAAAVHLSPEKSLAKKSPITPFGSPSVSSSLRLLPHQAVAAGKHMSTKQLPLREVAPMDHAGRPTPAKDILCGMGETLLALVCDSAPREQLASWLRVPLEHAGARGDLECVLKLLAAGADPRVQRVVRDRSPLVAAAQGGNSGVVSALLRSGVAPDGDENEKSFSSPCDVISVPSASSDNSSTSCSSTGGTGGWTPLHFAASGGHVAIVRELVRAGADVDIEDEEGCSAVHLAVFRGFEEVVKELVRTGANVDTRDSEGETPLHTACSHGNVAMVREILRGSDGQTLFAHGSGGDQVEMSPLHRAALGGHCQVMRELLDHASSVNFTTGSSRTVLHAAALSGSASAVHFLLDRDLTSLEEEDQEGRTALHLAAGHRLGSDGTLRALLDAGADVEHTTALGETALHAACKSLRVSAVQILLRSGANEAAADMDGRNAVDMASELLQSQCPGVFRDMLDEIMRSLVKAPVDRVWRRRGWLLMLRSRERTVGLRGVVNLSGWGMGMGKEQWKRGRSWKVSEISLAPFASLAWCGTSGRERKADVGFPIRCAITVDAGLHVPAVEALRSLVERVLGVDEDGVFRTIVSFI